MFNFEEDYVLENEVVRLVPLATPQKEQLFLEANEPAIWVYFLENGLGPERFDTYFAHALQQRQQQLEYPFAIFDRRQQRFAGMTRIYAVDNKLEILKIGHTWLGIEFQGTGLNRHCKYLLFDWVFGSLNFKRIGFGASAENQRSLRAMKAVGCQEEGRLRSFMPNMAGTARTDIVLLSLLQEEWLNGQRSRLKASLKL
ncbi:MAG: GNAT family protein [Bacteroidota bacterium]